jgi:phosphoglycolate phosphatase
MSNLTIVFDLDGTLVDTAPDLISTLNHVFATEGLPTLPFAEARTMIGGGGRRMIERGLEADGRARHAADVDRLFSAFIDHYAAHIADASRPYPGLEEALDRLAAAGARLAVCTNKLERLSVKLLTQLGLANRFAAICGQDTFGIQKPDPEMLRRTIAQAGGTVREAIMVGDSMNDVAAARGAGVPVVAVDFGYTEIPPGELGADRVISSLSELPAAIEAIVQERAHAPASGIA